MAAPRLLRLHAAFGGTDPVDGVSAPGLVLPAGAAADWNGLALPRCRFGGTSEFREFPGVVAAPAGEGEPVEEEFRIGGEAYRVSDPLPDARLGDEHEDPPPAFAAVDERIDATLDFARERVDRGRLVDAATGDGRLPRGRLLDTAGLVAAWQASFDPTVAPRRLVVRLAEALEDTLRDLARRPRRVLRRRREMQPVATVQQVDAACLRWISRRPGRTVAEKAGSRQEVLAVVRREEHDTLENRVARDVMLRCRLLSRAYLKSYGPLGGGRVERVTRFERTLRTALASGVSPRSPACRRWCSPTTRCSTSPATSACGRPGCSCAPAAGTATRSSVGVAAWPPSRPGSSPRPRSPASASPLTAATPASSTPPATAGCLIAPPPGSADACPAGLSWNSLPPGSPRPTLPPTLRSASRTAAAFASCTLSPPLRTRGPRASAPCAVSGPRVRRR